MFDAGLLRCGKSCRLRWMNYLRPDIKRGNITPEEDDLIIRMHSLLGNRWSLIAGRLPGRTDNEIKNYWNTHLCKKLKNQGPDPEEKPTSTSNKKKKKNNGGKKKNKQKNKGENDIEEPEKTKVYLPKPIRVKPLTLPRTDSNFTFDSSASTSQENNNKVESPEGITKEVVMNLICEAGNNVGENNDEFVFFGDQDHDLVNGSDVECQSYFPADHCTLQNLYEEYFQLLNMEDNHFDLDSFAESLLV